MRASEGALPGSGDEDGGESGAHGGVELTLEHGLPAGAKLRVVRFAGEPPGAPGANQVDAPDVLAGLTYRVSLYGPDGRPLAVKRSRFPDYAASWGVVRA